MKITKIKSKLLLLLLGIGIIFTLLFSLIAPLQTKHFCNKISQKDNEFIAKVMVKNIALDIQNTKSDSVAVLEQTLNLLKQDGEEQNKITSINVFDAEMKFLNGLNSDIDETSNYIPADKFIFEDNGDTLKVWSPMHDSEKEILGYVRQPR